MSSKLRRNRRRHRSGPTKGLKCVGCGNRIRRLSPRICTIYGYTHVVIHPTWLNGYARVSFACLEDKLPRSTSKPLLFPYRYGESSLDTFFPPDLTAKERSLVNRKLNGHSRKLMPDGDTFQYAVDQMRSFFTEKRVKE